MQTINNILKPFGVTVSFSKEGPFKKNFGWDDTRGQKYSRGFSTVEETYAHIMQFLHEEKGLMLPPLQSADLAEIRKEQAEVQLQLKFV